MEPMSRLGDGDGGGGLLWDAFKRKLNVQVSWGLSTKLWLIREFDSTSNFRNQTF